MSQLFHSDKPLRNSPGTSPPAHPQPSAPTRLFAGYPIHHVGIAGVMGGDV